MKPFNLENTLLVDRKDVTIPISDFLPESGNRLSTKRAPMMKQAKFRRLFNRHQCGYLK
jgi:hypothetical protein